MLRSSRLLLLLQPFPLAARWKRRWKPAARDVHLRTMIPFPLKRAHKMPPNRFARWLPRCIAGISFLLAFTAHAADPTASSSALSAFKTYLEKPGSSRPALTDQRFATT